MPMPVVHQFANGVMNPLLAYAMAFVGCLLGVSCTARARRTIDGGKKIRWLVYAGAAIGGGGVWVTHMMAMLGFDVPATPLRYDIATSAASLAVAVAIITIGIFIVGYGNGSVLRAIGGGLFTGLGITAMHYLAVSSMRMDAVVSDNSKTFIVSVGIAVIASTAALWLTVRARGWGRLIVAAAVMALGVASMHYTAMAGVRIHLVPDGGAVPGASPPELLMPIMLISIAALTCLLFGALDMMADESFSLRVNRSRLDYVHEETRMSRNSADEPHPITEVHYMHPSAKPIAHRR